MNNDFVELFSREFTLLANFKKIRSYNDYLFSLNVFKMQSIVKKILFTTDYSLTAFSFSLDLFLQNTFIEYEKRVLFIYNSSYLEMKNNALANTKNKLFPLFSISNINIYQKDILFLNETIKKNLKSSFCFEILISLRYCIHKLKELNFFHKLKYRPVGNVKYILLDDHKIIHKFVTIS